jgi:hypothetical protein
MKTMNPAGITSSAIDGSLKLIRRPLDLAVGQLPGSRRGPGAAARITVDRLDATVRGVLAAGLRDDRLKVDARRRSTAADERERALRLRREGAVHEAQAETRLEDRHEQASERRERASAGAASRRQRAERQRQSTTVIAKQTERDRTAASRRLEKHAEEAIDAQESAERLPAVEQQAEALQEQERALALADEARRAGDAAARVKQERKRG